jgi:hypothetical protein
MERPTPSESASRAQIFPTRTLAASSVARAGFPLGRPYSHFPAELRAFRHGAGAGILLWCEKSRTRRCRELDWQMLSGTAICRTHNRQPRTGDRARESETGPQISHLFAGGRARWFQERIENERTEDRSECAQFILSELRNVYSAERELTKALRKLAEASSSDELQNAFERHLEPAGARASKRRPGGRSGGRRSGGGSGEGKGRSGEN